MLVDFFAEVVAVGKAAGARFIRLAEYNPLDFHPDNPFEERLAAVNEMAKAWKSMIAKGRFASFRSASRPKWIIP